MKKKFNKITFILALIFCLSLNSISTNAYEDIQSDNNLSPNANRGIGDEHNYFTEDYFRMIEEWNEYDKLSNFKNLMPAYTSDYNFISTSSKEKSKYLPIRAFKQEKSYWCGPAVLQMGINYITGQFISQQSLANTAGTSYENGTYVYQITNTLNQYLTSKKYQSIMISNLWNGDFFNRAVYSIDNYRPTIYHVSTANLPGYGGADYGHYVIGYGYSYNDNTEYEPLAYGEAETLGYPGDGAINNRMLSYIDPWGNAFGKHTVLYKTLENAVNRNQGFIVSY